MGVCSDIQNSRSQNIWLTRETTKGVLQYPDAGTSTYFVASSTFTFNDQASYTDSEEKRESLNLRDQLRDKTKAGTFSFSGYARPTALTAEPQEGILLESALGDKLVESYTPVTGGYTNVATSIVVDYEVGMRVPPRGVLLNTTSNEQILYTAYNPTTHTFSGLTRGYNGTTAAAGLDMDTLSLYSKTYAQSVCANSFSMGVQVGETIYWYRGCSINSVGFTGAVNGYINFSYEGGYMQKYMAGISSYLSHTGGTATPAVITLGLTAGGVKQAKLYTVGARIQNVTQKDTNSGAGYTITAVDYDANTITLESCTLTGWTATDVIKGYLPEGTVTGDTLAAKYTDVYFDSVLQKPKGFDFTCGTPKTYVEDEITTAAISDFYSGMRDINGTITSYFRGSELSKFVDAENDTKYKVEARFGQAVSGDTLWVVMPRCTVQTPSIAEADTVLELSQVFTALDTDKEDSCFFIYV